MSPSPSSCRVLYVEDNPAEANLLDSILKIGSEPVELTVLEDGEEALQFIDFKPFRPDVIVLDLDTPRIDGLTVLATLKSDLKLKSIPVWSSSRPTPLIRDERMSSRPISVWPSRLTWRATGNSAM